MNSLYDILGIDKFATTDDIIKAYYKKAKHCHPDAGGNQEEFLKLNKAYKILSNPETREDYDKFGTIDEKVDKKDLITETLTSFMMSVINQLGIQILKADVFKILTDNFTKLITEETLFKTELNHKKIILNEAKKRLIKMDESLPDYFENLINSEISDIDRSINDTEKQIEIYNGCIDIIGKYSFRKD